MMKLFTWSAPQNTDPFAPYTVGIYKFGDYNDSSSFGNNLASGTNNSISSTQSKFGGSSLSVPSGTGARNILTPTVNMTGNFTIECYAYFTAWGASAITNTLFGSRPTSTGLGIDFAVVATGTKFQATIAPGTGAAASVLTSGNAGMSLNTWYHFAGVRNNNVLTLYWNGSNIASITHSTQYNVQLSLGALRFNAGSPSDFRPLIGYMDNARITTAARYTSNFTPPGDF